MLAIEHRFAVLVHGFADFHHLTVVRPFGVIGLAPHGHRGADRIPGKDRIGKAQPLVASGHGMRIDVRGRYPDADGQGHGAIGWPKGWVRQNSAST
jgi:hypothetical protein